LIHRLSAGQKYPDLRERLAEFELNELDSNKSLSAAEIRRRKLALFETILQASRHGDGWGEALAGLCDLDVKLCKKHAQDISERVKFLEQSGSLTAAEQASRLGDEYYYLSNVYSAIGQKAQARAFARRCVKRFDDMQAKSVLPASRAGQQGMVACLELAGDYSRATKILAHLVEVYPNEPTFLLRMARLMRKQKKSDLALKWIDRAEKVSYGYNWYRARLLKADTLLQLKKVKEANELLNQTLAKVTLDSDRESRNQVIVSRLRGLQAKVQEMK
jgi:tetratricopeptide (TPR) repeat protein